MDINRKTTLGEIDDLLERNRLRVGRLRYQGGGVGYAIELSCAGVAAGKGTGENLIDAFQAAIDDAGRRRPGGLQ